jgi:hypothetical protein
VPGLESASSWVVFSDLHVSTKSLTACVDVLRRVHEEARSRNAGVLFLGKVVWVVVTCVDTNVTMNVRHVGAHRGQSMCV